MVDPHETDQISFAKMETMGSEIGIEQISVLEKFVTKAIEQEESQKKIMVKLQERVIEESRHGQLDNNTEDQ